MQASERKAAGSEAQAKRVDTEAQKAKGELAQLKEKMRDLNGG